MCVGRFEAFHSRLQVGERVFQDAHPPIQFGENLIIVLRFVAESSNFIANVSSSAIKLTGRANRTGDLLEFASRNLA